MGEIMDSCWLYILLSLFLVVFLFVFFWTTPCTEGEVKKK